MSPPDQEIDRRRPVWDALSIFFLDTEVDDGHRRHIAQVISDSGYSPSEIETILWEEVFPVLQANLRDFFGEWEGFDLDWMQQQILSGPPRRTQFQRVLAALPGSPERMIRQEWQALLPFLPTDFRHHHNAD